MNAPTYIRASIIGHDCTAGGITSKRLHVLAPVERGHLRKEDKKIDAPPVAFVEADPKPIAAGYLIATRGGELRRVRAVPVDDRGEPMLDGMFGGHFIWSNDSRFPYASPVPVFDRFER
jgi:hypothetical protein